MILRGFGSRDLKKAHLAVCLAFVLLLSACGGAEADEEQQAAADERAVPSVEAVQAKYGALPLRERFSGTVRASGQVEIYPETSGPITQVLVQNGDRVQQGQALARVKAQMSQAQLSQARANLQGARAQTQQAKANLAELQAQFSRTEALAEDSLVSQQTLETQRAQVQAARASYQQAQAQVESAQAAVGERSEAVGQATVRAPISGRVGQRNAEVGMQADGQTALFTIGDLSEMRVEVPVTQELLGRIREGQPARILVGGGSVGDTTVVTAEVSRISPFLEEGSYSAEAEIDVTNQADVLRPGMFVQVDVAYGESQEATLVPTSALYDNPNTGVRGIYVASSLGEELQVQPGAGDGEAPLVGPVPMTFKRVEVVAEGGEVAGVRGIDPDAWVVVVGQHLLESGGQSQGEEGPSQPQARVRPIRWSRIASLQRLQRDDLLRQFMEKQQRVARQQPDSAQTGSRWSKADSSTTASTRRASL